MVYHCAVKITVGIRDWNNTSRSGLGAEIKSKAWHSYY